MFEEIFEESGLKYDGDAEVLMLYGLSINDAIEILGSDMENPHPLDDNGGEPDGPAWIVAADEIAPEIAGQIKASHLGYTTMAHVFTGYDGSREQVAELNEKFFGRWCGYSSRGVAYARDANE